MREVFKPIVFLMLFLSTFSLFSQNSRIVDSLRTLIAKAPDDSNKVNLYFTLSRQFDIFKSKDYFEINLAALNLSQKINFTSGINRHYSNVIRFLFQRGIYDLAIAYYHDYEQFLTENNMNDELQASYNMYGNLLSRQKKYSEAALFYHKAKDFQFSKNDDQKYANVLNNLSILYLNTGNYDSSLTYCSSALLIYKKNNSSSAIANSILGLAELYLKKGDFQMAESRVFESIDIYEILNEKQGLCNCYYVLGLIYNQTDNYPKSLLYTNKSLDLAKDLNLLEVQRDCYNNLSKAYHRLNNDAEAFQNHILFKNLNDSLASESLQGKMLEMEVKYDIIQKEVVLKKQQYEINAIRIGLGLVILLAIFIYRGFRLKQKTNKELEQKNILIAQQKELVDDKQKEILDSINYAKKIQYALLANEELLKTNLDDFFILFNPKDIVSGDFYWSTEHNGKFYIAVCDSTGHGVPGAFMSLLNMGFLNEAVKEKNITEPHEVFNFVRKRLIESIGSDGQQDGMDAILVCIDYHENNQIVTYAAANNKPVLVSNNSIIEHKADKMPVGKGERTEPFTLFQLSAKSGDMLYLYTDGFADQFGGPKGKKFKYKQLNELLLSINNKPMDEQNLELVTVFKGWKGDLEQVDDVLLVGIRFK